MTTLVLQSVERLKSSGLANGATVVGCTDQEIRKVEQEARLLLPQSYKDFLSMCGKQAGKFLLGTDWNYPKLGGLQASAADLIRSSGIEAPLPSTAFVFAMHQGYQFLFFHCDSSGDPPVYLFLDGSNAPEQVSDSFSKWLSQCVEDEIAAYSEV